jgi:hypothetical protein
MLLCPERSRGTSEHGHILSRIKKTPPILRDNGFWLGWWGGGGGANVLFLGRMIFFLWFLERLFLSVISSFLVRWFFIGLVVFYKVKTQLIVIDEPQILAMCFCL